MSEDYVRKHITVEVMKQLRKEYPNHTDDEIIKVLTKIFNQVGGIVVSLVMQVWETVKDATKDMTVEDLKKYVEHKKEKVYKYISIDGLTFHEAEVMKSKLNNIKAVTDYECEGTSRDTFGDMRYVIKVLADNEVFNQLKEVGKFYKVSTDEKNSYADRIINEVNKRERNITGGLN